VWGGNRRGDSEWPRPRPFCGKRPPTHRGERPGFLSAAEEKWLHAAGAAVVYHCIHHTSNAASWGNLSRHFLPTIPLFLNTPSRLRLAQTFLRVALI